MYTLSRAVCLALIAATSSAFADDKADVARVEKEIARYDEAKTIYRQSHERAWAAIKKSSIPKRYAGLKESTRVAYRKYQSALPGTWHGRLLKKKWIEAKKKETDFLKRVQDIARTLTAQFWKEKLKDMEKVELDSLRRKFERTLQTKTRI